MLPPGAVPAQDTLAVGLDIESADNLPSLGDPWSEPFYVENFTRAEMAWCLRQPDPKMSFCGFWSAKEAALKCGQEFAGLRPIEIEILHDQLGRPVLRPLRAFHVGRASDWVLSISHAGRMGLAVCVRKPRASRATDPKPDVAAPPLPFNGRLKPLCGPKHPLPRLPRFSWRLWMLALLQRIGQSVVPHA